MKIILKYKMQWQLQFIPLPLFVKVEMFNYFLIPRITKITEIRWAKIIDTLKVENWTESSNHTGLP